MPGPYTPLRPLKWICHSICPDFFVAFGQFHSNNSSHQWKLEALQQLFPSLSLSSLVDRLGITRHEFLRRSLHGPQDPGEASRQASELRGPVGSRHDATGLQAVGPGQWTQWDHWIHIGFILGSYWIHWWLKNVEKPMFQASFKPSKTKNHRVNEDHRLPKWVMLKSDPHGPHTTPRRASGS